MPHLLERLASQTLLPREIIVVDSSPSAATRSLVLSWRSSPHLLHRTVDFAYPGHARNLGVAVAASDWIAFVDARTIPRNDWLERSFAKAEETQSELVCGLCEWDADSAFKQLLRAATYGEEACRSVPGSLISKTAFNRVGGFVASVRAGEDLEWLARAERLGVRTVESDRPNIRYYGFPASLIEAMRKWFVYAFASASIEVRNDHKSLYLGVFLSSLVFLAYRWNAVFAQWEMESILYVPNITKIALVVVAVAYFLYRGILRPLRANVSPSFLFPWRWLAVGLVGLCLDLAKAPGLLWGALLLLKRRVAKSGGYWCRRRPPATDPADSQRRN